VTRYVIDTDVIIALRNADAASTLGTRGELPLLVTDVVWDELRAPGDAEARNEKYAQAIAGKATQINPESPEAATFLGLQAALPKPEGPGELSVIAYCHHHLDTTAVLMDKAALRRAVEELRGRVLSFQGFIGALMTDGLLDLPEANAIVARYRKQYVHARVPVWWPV
jgi:hypothetical protein